MNPKTVLKYATDQGAKFVSVRFTDLPGSWQHLTFPIAELGESSLKMASASTRHRFVAGPRFTSQTCCSSPMRPAFGWIRLRNNPRFV